MHTFSFYSRSHAWHFQQAGEFLDYHCIIDIMTRVFIDSGPVNLFFLTQLKLILRLLCKQLLNIFQSYYDFFLFFNSLDICVHCFGVSFEKYSMCS